MKPILILCSVPTREVGLKLSRMLIEQCLVACVQVLPQITSIYSWEGKICEETESLLLIKALKFNFSKIENTIKEAHPYSVPEIVSISIDQVNEDYLHWMQSVIKKVNV